MRLRVAKGPSAGTKRDNEVMNIGVLGTGDVGKALGNAFLATGHSVRMGSREAGSEKAAAWAAQASAGTFAEAAAFAELAVLATLWSGTENALQLAGPDALAGKIVVDATNPLIYSPGHAPQLALGHSDSGGEQVQRWLPKARVVKAFNTVGYAHFYQPDFPGGPPDMFICGNDDAAKRTVTEILLSFGWPSIDTGGIEGARLQEPLCVLWVGYAMRYQSTGHAFKLLRK
jgi:8-hydroxy-5-deazaflavin:NADPH oxidoreductase